MDDVLGRLRDLATAHVERQLKARRAAELVRQARSYRWVVGQFEIDCVFGPFVFVSEWAMPKRSSTARLTGDTRDFTAVARRVVEKAIGERLDGTPLPPSRDEGKNPAAVALGKLGGPKGGAARAQALSASRRREIAQKAARARWKRR